MSIAAGVMIAGGTIAVIGGVVATLGKLPRNRLAGVRTVATMRSDQAFEVGNRVAGPAVVAGGVAAVASGSIALLLPVKAAVACISGGAVVMLVLIAVGGVLGDRAARRTAG